MTAAFITLYTDTTSMGAVTPSPTSPPIPATTGIDYYLINAALTCYFS